MPLESSRHRRLRSRSQKTPRAFTDKLIVVRGAKADAPTASCLESLPLATTL
jgi:hypothetical protein